MWKEQTLIPRAPPLPLSPSLRDSHSLCLFIFPFMFVIIVHAERPLLRFTNLKYLDHEQLFVWLCAHPRFMAVDYQHDIGKLKGITIILIACPFIVKIFIHYYYCRRQSKWWYISEPEQRLTGALWIVYWIPNTTDENYWGSGMLLTLNIYNYFIWICVLQKMYPQFPETKIELQLHQQKSLKSVLTASTDSSGTGVQSTETSTIL